MKIITLNMLTKNSVAFSYAEMHKTTEKQKTAESTKVNIVVLVE